MPGALNVLLTLCLLQCTPSQTYWSLVPAIIEVFPGSCVTIPCSFDIDTDQDGSLDDTCKGIWIYDNKLMFDGSSPREKGKLLGELRKKNCTITLNDIVGSGTFYFRLECDNNLNYNFDKNVTTVLFKDDPPSLILTTSTLNVNEGTFVNLTCSAFIPCWSHPPNLTWTPNLGESQETQQENQNKTKYLTSALTFIASHHHHGENVSCSAVYRTLDGNTKSAKSEQSLTLNISFAPHILSFSCNKTTVKLRCSCEAVGNPSPHLQWISEDVTLNSSDVLSIINKSLNSTVVRSSIIVSLQVTKLSTLLCHSVNSLGSATQTMNMFESSCQGAVIAVVVIAVVLTAVIVVLLAIITRGIVCSYITKSQSLDDTAAMSQSLTREMRTQVTNTAENHIYANTIQKSTHWRHQRGQVGSKSSTENENHDVVYTSVIWKGKKRGASSHYKNPPGSSHMEQESGMTRDESIDFVSNMADMETLYSDIKSG